MRWYMPGDLGRVIPDLSDHVFSHVRYYGRPSLDYRLIQFYNRRAEDWPNTDPEDLEMRANTKEWASQLGLGRRGRAAIGHSFKMLTKDEDLRNSSPGIFSRLGPQFRNLTDPGIWSTYYLNNHPTLSAYDENYYLNHDLIDRFESSYGEGNLEIVNPDVVEQFTQVIRDRFNAWPGNMMFTIAPNDVYIPSLSPESLAKLPPLIRERIINETTYSIERNTLRIHPPDDLDEIFWDNALANLAEFHVNVAKKVFETHPDYIVGGFITHRSQVSHYSSQTDLPPNLAFVYLKTRSSLTQREERTAFYERIKDFANLVSTPPFVWEYHLWNWRAWNGRPTMDGYPVFFPSIISHDMHIMHSLKMFGEYSNSWSLVHSHPGLNHLNTYLIGKLLSNNDLTVESVFYEYLHLFYSTASVPMEAFWKRAEECWLRNVSGMDPRVEANEIRQILFTTEDLAFLRARLEDAKALVPTGSLYWKRINLIENEMIALE